MLPKVALIGRPNVGKSTLFNRIIGKRLSITDDEPGVTRDRIYSRATWLDKDFFLIDTGGIELSDAPFLEEIRAQAEIAMEEADVIVFVCDTRQGLTDDDNYVGRMLHKTKKPVILCCNKVDDNRFKDDIYDFYALGFGDPVVCSSTHGIGVGDLLDLIVKSLPAKLDDEKDDSIHFCVIGRPNVGKSSLVNAILKEERDIVSNIEGTTRDTIDTKFQYKGKDFTIIDTAGLRKRGKIYENIEKYSVIRAIDAISRADVCVLVVDAERGLIEQDAHVGQYVQEANKPVIIAVNKWDTVEKDSKTMKKWEDDVKKVFSYLPYAPIIFISALENKRIDTLFPEIERAYDAYHRRIQTSVLNDIVMDAQAMFPPSEFKGGKLRIYYVTQTGVEPPTFSLFVNDPSYLHFSYFRYLENQIRKNFDFYATPIKLEFRKRD